MKRKQRWIECDFKMMSTLPKGSAKGTIDLETGEVRYYRKEIPTYIVRWWDETLEDFKEAEFKTLGQAKKFGLKFLDIFDINYYKDYTYRFWSKQYQYKDKELVGEDEQYE